MLRKHLILALLLIPFKLIGQLLPPNDPETVYSQFHNVLKSNKPVQYIGTGPFSDNGDSQWIMFEGLVAPEYTIYRGRDANKDWVQRGSISFVPSIRLRMYNEESFPVRPPNFNPYFSFYYLISNFRKEANPDNFTYLEFQLAHLSNGQTESFFNADSTINLKSGNFSTNYYKVGITRSQYLPGLANVLLDSALVSATFMYRDDWSLKGSPFVIDEALDGRYALQRMNFVFQLRTKNINQGKYNYNRKVYNRQLSYLLRIDNEYRIGDVIESEGRDRRYSIDMTLAIYPANWRMFGLLMKYYNGRDNYNIRFNRKISFFQFGFVVDFDKFQPRNYKLAN